MRDGNEKEFNKMPRNGTNTLQTTHGYPRRPFLYRKN